MTNTDVYKVKNEHTTMSHFITRTLRQYVPDYGSITTTVNWSLATKITHREYIYALKFAACDLVWSKYQGYKAKRIAWLEFGTPFRQHCTYEQCMFCTLQCVLSKIDTHIWYFKDRQKVYTVQMKFAMKTEVKILLEQISYQLLN